MRITISGIVTTIWSAILLLRIQSSLLQSTRNLSWPNSYKRAGGIYHTAICPNCAFMPNTPLESSWRREFLKNMALIVSDNPKSVRMVVWYIECAVNLHILLLVAGGLNDDEWLQHKDDASTVAHDNIEFDNTLMMPFAPGGPNDERRSRLLHNFFRD